VGFSVNCKAKQRSRVKSWFLGGNFVPGQATWRWCAGALRQQGRPIAQPICNQLMLQSLKADIGIRGRAVETGWPDPWFAWGHANWSDQPCGYARCGAPIGHGAEHRVTFPAPAGKRPVAANCILLSPWPSLQSLAKQIFAGPRFVSGCRLGGVRRNTRIDRKLRRTIHALPCLGWAWGEFLNKEHAL
jgi:hypothetical protein